MCDPIYIIIILLYVPVYQGYTATGYYRCVCGCRVLCVSNLADPWPACHHCTLHHQPGRLTYTPGIYCTKSSTSVVMGAYWLYIRRWYV